MFSKINMSYEINNEWLDVDKAKQKRGIMNENVRIGLAVNIQLM